MLIENTQPCARSVGTVILIPGVNRVDKALWEVQLKGGFGRPVKGLIEEGILIMQDESKITISLVQRTYKVDVLEDWLETAKGPLKGAIKKQIALMTDEGK